MGNHGQASMPNPISHVLDAESRAEMYKHVGSDFGI